MFPPLNWWVQKSPITCISGMIVDCTAEREKSLQTEINIDVIDAILLGFILLDKVIDFLCPPILSHIKSY